MVRNGDNTMNGESQRTSDFTRKLIDQYSAVVYRLALSYTSCAADAEDIMQEVFLRFVRKNISFESPEHEKAWFIRVTVNCCKSFLSSQWKRRVVHTGDIGSYGLRGGGTGGETSSVYEAVMALPPNQRLCVHLFYYEDMAIKEIAESTGMKESTVKSHLFRARDSLKNTLKGEYCDVQR